MAHQRNLAAEGCKVSICARTADELEKVRAEAATHAEAMAVTVDVSNAADLERFAPLGVAVVMEPSFCCAQTGLNYDLEHELPTDRWRSFLDHGTTLAFASDWPSAVRPALLAAYAGLSGSPRNAPRDPTLTIRADPSRGRCWSAQ